MRILVCGGRDFTGYTLLFNILEEIWNREHKPGTEFVVIEGDATGADFLAKCWVIHEFKHPKEHLETYPANWKLYGKKAGPIRNQQMLDEGKPDIVLAFPTENSVGTWDMIERAKKNNLDIRIFE